MAITGRMTLHEFLALPEGEQSLEYERGRVSEKMSPAPRHGRLQGMIFLRLEMHGAPHQVVIPFSEARVIWLAEEISYTPDVIAYLAEHVPADAAGELPDYFTVPPDIAVEIASPGQSLAQQINRCRWYVAHGVSLALLVEPERRAVWIFRAGTQQGPLTGTDLVDLAPEVPGLAFTVDDLFSALRVRPE